MHIYTYVDMYIYTYKYTYIPIGFPINNIISLYSYLLLCMVWIGSRSVLCCSYREWVCFVSPGVHHQRCKTRSASCSTFCPFLLLCIRLF